MASLGTTFTSGDWVVSEGREDEFIAAWTAFVRWSVENFSDFHTATLIRQDDSPRHFISFGEWARPEAVAEWRQHPEFPEKIHAPRSLCEQFAGLDYKVVSTVP